MTDEERDDLEYTEALFRRVAERLDGKTAEELHDFLGLSARQLRCGGGDHGMQNIVRARAALRRERSF